MNTKILGLSAVLISMTAGPALAQSVVTAEQVRALPAPTLYVTPDGKRGLEINKGVFKFNGPLNCTGLTKAGGNGNATMNCSNAGGQQFRFEWIDLSRVKLEAWENMGAKAGTLRNKPAQVSMILKRR